MLTATAEARGWNNWCHSCEREERADAQTYQVCHECNHVFQTARDLKRAYRELPNGTWPKHIKLTLWTRFRGWLHRTFLKADSIFFCPRCLHDF